MIHSASAFIFLDGAWHFAGPQCWCQPQLTALPIGYIYIGHRAERRGEIEP